MKLTTIQVWIREIVRHCLFRAFFIIAQKLPYTILPPKTKFSCLIVMKRQRGSIMNVNHYIKSYNMIRSRQMPSTKQCLANGTFGNFDNFLLDKNDKILSRNFHIRNCYLKWEIYSLNMDSYGEISWIFSHVLYSWIK